MKKFTQSEAESICGECRCKDMGDNIPVKSKKQNKFKPFQKLRRLKNWVQDQMSKRLTRDYEEYYK